MVYVKINTTGATSGAETAYPSGEPEFIPGFSVSRSLVLYVCFVDRCLFFFFWPLCCSIYGLDYPFGIFKLFLRLSVYNQPLITTFDFTFIWCNTISVHDILLPNTDQNGFSHGNRYTSVKKGNKYTSVKGGNWHIHTSNNNTNIFVVLYCNKT